MSGDLTELEAVVQEEQEGLASSAMRHEGIGDKQLTRVDQDVPDTISAGQPVNPSADAMDVAMNASTSDEVSIIVPSETADSPLVDVPDAGTTVSPACDRMDQIGIIGDALDVKQEGESAVFFDAMDVSEEPLGRDNDTQHDGQQRADDQEQQNPISANLAINDADAEMDAFTPHGVSSGTAHPPVAEVSNAGTTVELLSRKMRQASIVDEVPIADNIQLEVESGDLVLQDPMTDMHCDDSVCHVDQDTISANHADGNEGNMDILPPYVSTTSDITSPETADTSVAEVPGPMLDGRTDQAIIEETPYPGGHGKLKTECMDDAVIQFPPSDSPSDLLTSEPPTETQGVIDDSQTLACTRSSVTKSSNTTLDSVPKEQDVLSTDQSGSGMMAPHDVQAEPEPHASCSIIEDGAMKPVAVNASSEPTKIDGMFSYDQLSVNTLHICALSSRPVPQPSETDAS